MSQPERLNGGKDDVGAHHRAAVLEERVGIAWAEVRLNIVVGEVDLRHFSCGGGWSPDRRWRCC